MAAHTPSPKANASSGRVFKEKVMGVDVDLSKYRTKFHKIDLHTHILPEHLPDLEARFGEGNWVRLEHHCANKARMFQGGKFFRDVEENCYRAEPRLAENDKTGVTVQVLSTVPVMFSYNAKPEDTHDLSVLLNDDIANICKRHPKRFLGLGTLPMQAPELAVQELERMMQLPGMVGIQIGSHVNSWPLSEPKLFPIWEAAERLGAAIFIHPWDMPGDELMKKYWLPWLVGMPAETSFAICSLIFGGVFERFPNLRVCFAHGGGSFPGTIGRIEHGFHCRPDLVAVDNKRNPREYLGHFWVDSLVHEPQTLELLCELFSRDKILLGSDFPFPLGEAIPGELIEWMEWTDHEKAQILWHNGLKFLGVNASQFLDDKDVAEGDDTLSFRPLVAEPSPSENPPSEDQKPDADSAVKELSTSVESVTLASAAP